MPRLEPLPTHYERLGLDPRATPAEVTSAYRRLLLSLHPDSAPAHSDPRALQEVIASYRVLSDQQRRRDYDRHLARTPEEHTATDRATCGVCQGAGTLLVPCGSCAGTGYRPTATAWLSVPIPCPTCTGLTYMRIACGACAGSGRQT